MRTIGGMSSQSPLLIAGGGIAGQAAALALARTGQPVRVLERASVLAEVGAGVQIGPNVTRILHAWGLAQALGEVAASPPFLSVRSAATAAELGRLPLGAEMQARYGAPYLTIHRADLHRLLHQAAERLGAPTQLNQAVQDFAPQGQGVRVRTADADEHGPALLGADGIWGRVRQGLLADGPPQPTGHLAYRALLDQARLPAACRSQHVGLWLGPRLHLVHYPVRGGQWLNVVAIVHGPAPADMSDWDHAANAADLARALGPVCAPLQALLQAAPAASCNPQPWRLWPLAARPPVSGPQALAQGRVALLGDAAHPMRPYLAQGAGMAIEDAATLAACLQAQGPGDQRWPRALAAYAQARWQRVAQVQARSARNGQIFHASGPVRWGRDGAMRLLGRRLLDQPWLYGHQVKLLFK